MRFDLSDLRLFLHVVEAGSITHGGAHAGMGLGSASERVRAMEEAGAVLLLERLPRGVRPTPAGEALAHHARVVFSQLEQMRGDLRMYAQGLRGHVRVLSNTAALTFLSDAMRQFLAAHPSIDIDLKEKTSIEIVAAVAGGLADFGICADTADTGALETLPVGSDRLVLIVPTGHAVAASQTVALRDVLDEPFIGLPEASALQAYLAGHAAREGRPFKFRVRYGNYESVCAMVGQGIGLAIVPEAAVRKHQRDASIQIIDLSDKWAARQLIICARQFSKLSAHARQLIECLNHPVPEAVAHTSDP